MRITHGKHGGPDRPSRSMVASELLIIEYEQLKEEQRVRISTRDNLAYTTLGAFALVIAAVIQAQAPAVLVLLPPVCMILGWTYLINDDRVTAIGRHIRENVAPELVSLGDLRTEVFSWERRHRADRRRRFRKILQLMADLLLFCVTAFAALLVAWIREPHSGVLTTLIVFEAAGVALLTVIFTRNAVRGHI
ncbi:hypothetical protein [Streptosporangium sp. NPDC004631]